MNTAEFKLEFNKTYATADNARKAVQKEGFDSVRHCIVPVLVDGVVRYAPLFTGERAMQQMIHFKFNVIG